MKYVSRMKLRRLAAALPNSPFCSFGAGMPPDAASPGEKNLWPGLVVGEAATRFVVLARIGGLHGRCSAG